MKHEWLFWLILAIPGVPALVALAGCWWVTRSDEAWARFRGRPDS